MSVGFSVLIGRLSTESRMKLLLCLCLAVATVMAQTTEPQFSYSPDDVKILRYENDNKGNGKYRYAFEQSDGNRQEQRGELKNVGRDDEGLAVQGSFSWIAPNGRQYTVTYTADAEGGYRPEIEEGPGIPPNVLASALG